MKKLAAIAFVLASCVAGWAGDTTSATVQTRVSGDVAAGEPIVTHIVVVLCDNLHQGIVPVPPRLGNGQKPRDNLYWGAAYGVRTFLTKRAGWEVVEPTNTARDGQLAHLILRTELKRDDKLVEAILVAEAWDGRRMEEAVNRFLRMASGNLVETIGLGSGDQRRTVRAGGAGALIGFVGHNGLMDFSAAGLPREEPTGKPRGALVLACSSKPYFQALLEGVGAHPVLLTTGLMAPEAYTLDAAVRAFVAGKPPEEVRDTSATAYATYQRCSEKSARRLLFSAP